MKLTMIAAASVVLIAPAQAQIATEKYDLQERCGKLAAEAFAQEWSEEQSSQYPSRGNYEGHYSSRLSKCFSLETINIFGNPPSRMTRLFDLNQSRMIGEYSKTADNYVFCRVQQKRCKSEAEWRALIKPFMED
jgi:hypothetical protein